MCEICDMKADCEKMNRELEFRIQQYILELEGGRQSEADAAKARFHEVGDKLFSTLDQMQALMEKNGADVH